MVPVLAFGDTALVGFSERTFMLQGRDCDAKVKLEIPKLRHGVQGVGTPVENLMDMGGDGGARRPVGR